SIPIPASLRIVASALPNTTRLGRVRLIARDGSRADTTVVGIGIAAASLLPSASTLADDTPGDGDGMPESGETASWSWRIANAGSGAARGVTLRARTPAAGVTLLDSVAAVIDLDPGASAPATLPIRFALSSSVPGRLFDLHIEDGRGHSWVFPVSRTLLPAPPTGLHVNGSTENGIELGWSASPPAGLLGYHVYRALDDGSPLGLVTSAPTRAIPLYQDTGLGLLTRYRYAVSAVDSSGNEGALSSSVIASTTPPGVAGWPAEMGQPTSSNICLGDLDGDGKPELVVGSDYLYAFHADGTELRDGDANPVSTGIFSTLLHSIASSPAIADLDLDGTPEIIAASWNDSLVAVFRPDGTLLPGWPKKGAAPFWSSPAIGDIDNDGQLEVVIGSNASRLYAWHADGTEVRDGDANPATDGVLFVPSGTVISSPAIADLDGDQTKEIVFGTSAGRVYAIHPDGPLPGWPFVASGLFSSSPAIGNIVPAPGLEIAMASSNDSLYVLTAAGARAAQWPRPVELTPGNGRTNSPVLAPLRLQLGDSTLQIIIAGADGSLRVFEPDGTVTAGFAALTVDAPTEASPAVADLNGDGAAEILIGAEDRRVYAF
ncbi:MAG: FG-GAP-like repeat-containing protein, partial [Candidatus Eisenbacteria bacterium]